MRVLYFAWLRERVGCAEEEVTPPEGVRDVAGLIAWLAGRSEAHGRAFLDPGQVRVAVNQEFAAGDTRVSPGDEVAFFPPVTGG